MSQETINIQETKKDSGESTVCTTSDVLSQETMNEKLDNRNEFNAFYLDLKRVLEKHNVRIETAPYSNDSFFEINGEYSSYPILLTIIDDLNIEESCGERWERFVVKTPNGKPTNLFPPSLRPLSSLSHSS